MPYTYEGAENAKTSNLSFAESQPDSYQGQYAALASWVDASLEDLRPELTQVSTPCCLLPRLMTVDSYVMRIYKTPSRAEHW